MIGRDRDFGYTAFRFSEDVPWNPTHLAQPLVSPLSGLFFQYSIGAFDILSSDVTFDTGANVFRVHAHTAGNIADVASAAYVFGFNRGGATNSPFADIGVPGVTFDATALLRANGTGLSGTTPLTARVDGADIFATIDASVLPSKGFAPEDFTWTLWSIDSQIQGKFRNADFAPGANVQVAAVPEPETYALMLAGLGAMGFVGRRRGHRRHSGANP